MHANPYEELLNRAALERRIEPEFWDIWKRHHVTSSHTKRAVLKGFGVNTETPEGLESALENALRREWLRPLPPTVVTEAGGLVPVRVPRPQASSTVSLELRLEDGGALAMKRSLADAPSTGEAKIDGRAYVEKSVALPADLPLGYHELRLRIGDSLEGFTRLIIAPERAYRPEFLEGDGKAAGIAIALYGVRSARNWGCGDLRDLYPIVDWVASDLRASFIALNPLHAIQNRRP
jgi:hypothetical protein